MMGNMQIYAGADKFNAYGHFLHGVPELLWIVRIGLLLAVGLHIWASVGLGFKEAFRSPCWLRPASKNTVSTYASRTMYWSGPILLAFVIYHLLHLTVGAVHPGSTFQEGDVYGNTVERVSSLVCVRLVHLQHDPAGSSPAAWRLEHVPVLGHQSSSTHARSFANSHLSSLSW